MTMVKYQIKLGYRHQNVEARRQRNSFKQDLRGMHCKLCKTDTIIYWADGWNHHPEFRIKACCPYFERRIREKFGVDY
jgi:hypothetical protein